MLIFKAHQGKPSQYLHQNAEQKVYRLQAQAQSLEKSKPDICHSKFFLCYQSGGKIQDSVKGCGKKESPGALQVEDKVNCKNCKTRSQNQHIGNL